MLAGNIIIELKKRRVALNRNCFLQAYELSAKKHACFILINIALSRGPQK